MNDSIYRTPHVRQNLVPCQSPLPSDPSLPHHRVFFTQHNSMMLQPSPRHLFIDLTLDRPPSKNQLLSTMCRLAVMRVMRTRGKGLEWVQKCIPGTMLLLPSTREPLPNFLRKFLRFLLEATRSREPLANLEISPHQTPHLTTPPPWHRIKLLHTRLHCRRSTTSYISSSLAMIFVTHSSRLHNLSQVNLSQVTAPDISPWEDHISSIQVLRHTIF